MSVQNEEANGGWVEFNGPYSGPSSASHPASFLGRGLSRPGTLIEMADGRQHLIGHVNEQGGCCNCCPGFGGTDVVRRYRVVWAPAPAEESQKSEQ
jgi:hypothetical protein